MPTKHVEQQLLVVKHKDKLFYVVTKKPPTLFRL